VPTLLVAGFGVAAELAAERLMGDAAHGEHLRRTFLDALHRVTDRWTVNAEPDARLPGSLNICFEGVDGDSLVDQLGRIVDIATGSACAAGKIDYSQVLKAIGLSDKDARSSIRLYFHRYLDEGAAVRAASAIGAAANRFRLVTGDLLQ
jgi:cysteine desulfurase